MRLLLATLVAGLVPATLWAQPVPNTTAPAALQTPGEIVQAEDWRFAQPGATVIGGVNLQHLLSSPLVQRLMQESAGQDPGAAAMLGIAEMALGRLEGIRFSVRQNGTNTPDALLLVEGPLEDSLLQMLKQSAESQAAEADDPADPVALPEESFDWRRIDANTVLIGSGAGLDEAVARLSAAAAVPLSAASLAGGAALNTAHDFWISGAVPDAPATAGVDQQVDGFALGLSLGENMELEAAAVIPDATQAQLLLDMLNGFMAGQTERFTGELRTSLDQVAVPGKATARMSVTVPAEDILRALQEAQTSAESEEGFAEEDVAPRTNASGSGSKGAGTIVIDGLEGGSREIPYSK